MYAYIYIYIYVTFACTYIFLSLGFKFVTLNNAFFDIAFVVIANSTFNVATKYYIYIYST